MIREVLVTADDTPRMPQTNYEQCSHLVLWRDGFDPTRKRGKAQRYRCPSCGQQIVAGADSLRDKRLRIGRDLMRGLSIRAVARHQNVSRVTVRKLLRMIADRRPACACGRPAGHRGRALRICASVVNS